MTETYWQQKSACTDTQGKKRTRSRVVRDVLKLCALRSACTVSRGGSRSNVASLPDNLITDENQRSYCHVSRNVPLPRAGHRRRTRRPVSGPGVASGGGG